MTSHKLTTFFPTLTREDKERTDLKSKITYRKRQPVIGIEIDEALAEVVRRYNFSGVPITNTILHSELMAILRARNKYDILNRVIPEFEEWGKDKVKDLIVGGDETNTQFAPSVRKTRCPRGTRRVRIVGIGKEKPQITVKISCTAAGTVLGPTQPIFGGKTDRCHPGGGKSKPPTGLYYDHTETHWQTPASFVTYIAKVLIPYRHDTLQRLGLPSDQKMLYIMDLHYSHRDASVLALLAASNVIPIFIPAGCTDLYQVCDVVVNKPYKNGVSAAFIDYVSEKFGEWHSRADRAADEVFILDMNSSALKPQIPSYVLRGVERITTANMANAIKKCFQEEGLVALARLEETRARAAAAQEQQALRGTTGIVHVPEGDEREEDLGGVVETGEEAPAVTVDETNLQEFYVEVGVMPLNSVDKDDDDLLYTDAIVAVEESEEEDREEEDREEEEREEEEETEEAFGRGRRARTANSRYT